MRPTAAALSLAVFAAGAFLAAAQTSDQVLTFRAETALVRLDVQVEQDGRLITALRREDFIVYDEGQPQPVLHFSTDSAPIDLILLLDVSESMGWLAQELDDAGISALTALHPDDRVALMVFDVTGKLLVPFTTNRASLVEPIRKLAEQANTYWDVRPSWRPKHAFTRGTNMYEALRDACRYLWKPKRSEANKATRNRRVILMLTDGFGSVPAYREKAMLRDLWEADATVDTMIVDPFHAFLRLRRRGNPQDVFKTADETGGMIFVAQQDQQVTSTFKYVLERSRTRYTLYHRRPECERGTLRQVRVELAPEAQLRFPSAKLRARRSYYAK